MAHRSSFNEIAEFNLVEDSFDTPGLILTPELDSTRSKLPPLF